jgi:hypothetical protein
MTDRNTKGDRNMKILKAIASGLVGALTLTLINESARRVHPEAPRAEKLGMRWIAMKFRKADQPVPDRKKLYWLAFTDDLFSNTVYYSLVGAGSRKGAWVRGALLGTGGGIGAVVLPPQMKLGKGPTARSGATQVMTVTWYLLGGLAAAAAFNLFDRGEHY